MKAMFIVLAITAAAIGGVMMLANDLHEQRAAEWAVARASITNMGEPS